MIQNVSESSEKAVTQKEKNERLMAKINDFEFKNKEMKNKINNALLLKMGHLTIDEIKPQMADADQVFAMRQQLRSLVENQKHMYLEQPYLVKTPVASERGE